MHWRRPSAAPFVHSFLYLPRSGVEAPGLSGIFLSCFLLFGAQGVEAGGLFSIGRAGGVEAGGFSVLVPVLVPVFLYRFLYWFLYFPAGPSSALFCIVSCIFGFRWIYRL